MRFVKVPGTGVMFAVWETRVKDYESFSAGRSDLDVEWRNPVHRYETHFVFGPKRESVEMVQGPTHPVVNVSWVDAKNFCKWLTSKERDEGKIPATALYRLPTSAEWDVAAGVLDSVEAEWSSRNDRVYFWGGDWPPRGRSGNFCDASLRRRHPRTFSGEQAIRDYNDNYPYTAPVGQCDVNSHGLCDLAGNVFEWCDDRRNGERLGIDRQPDAVARGGCWNTFDKEELLASYRTSFSTSLRLNILGFRVVLETPDSRQAEK